MIRSASARRHSQKQVASYFALAIVVFLACVLLAVSFGTHGVSLFQAMSDASSMDRTIILRVRLPRVLLAALSGGGLAIVGAAFQGLLRNPLAEPYVLGVSGGAALGATIALVLGAGLLSAWGAAIVPIFALVGGLLATMLVYAIANASGQLSGPSVLLAGVMVNAIAGSLITFIKTLVSASKAQELLFWLMGFLDVPSGFALGSVAVYVFVGSCVLLADSARMNLLSLGDDSARHLGVNVSALEKRVYLAASLIVGAIVSVTGLIGFVGLVVPHAVRRLVGPDHRLVMPLSLLGGACMLVLCDLVARLAFLWLGTEPPVGAVTALVGGPLFLVLLAKRAA